MTAVGKDLGGKPRGGQWLVVDRDPEWGGGREVDHDPAGRVPDGVGEALRRRPDPMMIPRLVSGHRVERDRRIERCAGERSVDRNAAGEIAEVGADRDASAARLEADDAAAGGRDADRSAKVASLRESDHAGRHRAGAAAGGSARG